MQHRSTGWNREFRRLAAVCASSFALSVGPGVAVAQQTNAEALFEEGRSLLGQGKTEEACDAFMRSQALEPSAGTLLNLADCHARLGKNVDAYQEFRKAAEVGRKTNWPELVGEAERRAAELEATFPRITVQVPVPVDGLIITAGSEALDMSKLGQPNPIPPGEHTFGAKAPGYKPWSVTVNIQQGARVITVPALERIGDDPATLKHATVEPPETPQDSANSSGPGPWPFVLMGGGAALVVGGVITGVIASDKANQLSAACPSQTDCRPSLETTAKDATTLAAVADVLWIGGTVVALGGLGWWIFGGEDEPANAASRGALRSNASLRPNASLRLSPAPLFGGAGLTATGRF